MVKSFPVSFKNCRNVAEIDGGKLTLHYNRLNVLFGSNGTGKTTVSKVLDYWSDPSSTEKLDALKSFKYLQMQDPADAPNVITLGTKARQVLIFNSEWVDNHCFRDDGNLQVGAYELYVSSPEIKKIERERRLLLAKLNTILNDDETEAIRKLAETAAKGIGTSARGKVGSAFKDNAPLEGLPVPLKGVARGMKDQDKTRWMSWHVQGVPHAENAGDCCPYCGRFTPDLQDYIDFDKLHAVKQGEAWASAVSVFAEGELFRLRINQKALRLMSGVKKLDAVDKDWIVLQAQRAKTLADCIQKARSTAATYGENSSDQFFADIQTCLITLKDEIGFTDRVRAMTRKIVSVMNRILASEAKVRALADALEARAASNAAEYKLEIDLMLKKCGYPYTIEIKNNCSSRESRVVLVPRASTDPYGGQPRRTLSYGEQNTLALILFMFEAIAAKDSCIIVLDDPISSFDGDKRFALLYRMFHNFKAGNSGKSLDSLAGRTVVLLTHDYLVVSDVLTILENKVIKPHVLRLTCSRDGVLSHCEVGAEAVRPYIQMIRKRISESASRDMFFQLVYLRCYCEMMRKSKTDKRTGEGCAFIVISFVVDGDDWGAALDKLRWDGGPNRPYVLRTGESFIRGRIPGFDFKDVFEKLRDDTEICRLYNSFGITPYEKLQVLRLLIRQSKVTEKSPIMVRYANEVYHLAGDYLLQLDPVDFNPVPPFVEDWCDGMFKGFEEDVCSGT